jgi:hypothetical protein
MKWNVTAGELRSWGFKIPERIPDCAWTPWDSIKLDSVNVETCKNKRTLKGGFTLKCTEPFHWVTITGTFKKGEVKESQDDKKS